MYRLSALEIPRLLPVSNGTLTAVGDIARITPAPGSASPADTGPAIINSHTNPFVAGSLAGWGGAWYGGGAATVSVSTDAFEGANSYEANGTITSGNAAGITYIGQNALSACAPGDFVLVRAAIKCVSHNDTLVNVQVTPRYIRSDGSFVTENATTLPVSAGGTQTINAPALNTWYDVYRIDQVPVTAGYVGLHAKANFATAAGVTAQIRADAGMVAVGADQLIPVQGPSPAYTDRLFDVGLTRTWTTSARVSRGTLTAGGSVGFGFYVAGSSEYMEWYRDDAGASISAVGYGSGVTIPAAYIRDWVRFTIDHNRRRVSLSVSDDGLTWVPVPVDLGTIGAIPTSRVGLYAYSQVPAAGGGYAELQEMRVDADRQLTPPTLIRLAER